MSDQRDERIANSEHCVTVWSEPHVPDSRESQLPGLTHNAASNSTGGR